MKLNLRHSSMIMSVQGGGRSHALAGKSTFCANLPLRVFLLTSLSPRMPLMVSPDLRRPDFQAPFVAAFCQMIPLFCCCPLVRPLCVAALWPAQASDPCCLRTSSSNMPPACEIPAAMINSVRGFSDPLTKQLHRNGYLSGLQSDCRLFYVPKRPSRRVHLPSLGRRNPWRRACRHCPAASEMYNKAKRHRSSP